tara:strand:- start:1319 stop:2272 length:954 start_codon:yes stop_codon:yes gene_type:complete
MKKILIQLLAVALPAVTFGQAIPDSVTVFIDNRVEVLIEIDDYNKLTENNNAQTIITKFQAQLPLLKNELFLDKSELVTYTDDSLLTIEEGESKRIFLNGETALNNTGIRDKSVLIYKGLRVIISTNNLIILSEINMVECIQMVIDSLPEKTRKAQSLYYQCINGKVDLIEDKTVNNSFNDYIGISLGTGMSLLKNTSLVDFTFALDVVFLKKGAITHNGYVSTNLMFDFLGDRKMNINTFLNLGYRSYYFNKEKEEHFVGLEFGYLVSRQGDFFDESTFRLGLSKSINRHITFSTQLYMEDDLKYFYPGVRLDVNF